MVFIALVGPHGSGKETLANYLVNKYNFIKLSYREILMKVCKELFLLSDDEIKKENRNKPITSLSGITPKELGKMVSSSLNASISLQDERNKHIKLSILSWNITRKLISLRGKNVIIPDLKYSQDYLSLKMLGVKVIRIMRNGCEFDKEENDRIYYDFNIYNDTNIESLLLQAEKLVCDLVMKDKIIQN